jgi:hypothetical protein
MARARVLMPLAVTSLLLLAREAGAATEEDDLSTPHFVVSSGVKTPSPAEIGAHLEGAWRTFRDLFGVEPRSVRVVVSAVAAQGPGSARADQGGGASSTIAWTATEGEDLQGQGFSDLAHEIAHIYFLDVMGNPDGLHQSHAWLHEAVACLHESPSFVANREKWIRERLGERIPLAQLFEMRNPVKENPLVELTVELHGRLARGEISVAEMNQQISAWASSHSQELMQAGVRNMTYYAESLSVLQFLIAREGKAFVRAMAARLRDGAGMAEILRDVPHYTDGIASLESEWVSWVEAKPPR